MYFSLFILSAFSLGTSVFECLLVSWNTKIKIPEIQCSDHFVFFLKEQFQKGLIPPRDQLCCLKLLILKVFLG